ncbi:T9SS type A sorting domain-containing protein [Hyunsoonleella flava]|uniref:T9SS type A sorting domain-containing protein n=1 Tax=Hyunsoonleella flava TaxID=2527939 RepID=A0A4Q9FCS5_9FLAO|nr:T9SS type A sorting domain-containing protein [Hyunsoonleella flava]TBN02964.1 T9SS type A sorting domain-containing protein [Hyunsoonleella flava]
MKRIIVLLMMFKVFFLVGQSLEHPIIWTTSAEKSEVLSKIQNHSWASTIVSQVKGLIDSKVNAHVTNPNAFLNTIAALAADDNVSEANAGSAISNHASTLNHASYAALIYHLYGEEKYAQFAADVLWYYIEQLAPRTPDKTAMSGNYFADPRTGYLHFAMAYDFMVNYLKKPETRVYQKSSGNKIPFDNVKAQEAVHNIAMNALGEFTGVDNRYGRTVSNHPILTAPGSLFTILCVEDDAERERMFNVFWNTGTKRQNSFTQTILPIFGDQGIWPEPVSYSFMPNVTMVLNIVDRLKPELNVMDDYTQILDGNFLFDNLRHPNRTFVRFGDSKRKSDQTRKVYRYTHNLASRKGLTDYVQKAEIALRQGYDAIGGYDPDIKISTYENVSAFEQLFWGSDIPSIINGEIDFEKPTVIIKHAGVALQRNYVEENNEDYGLCGIIGGAHYVHSHCTGITMELYGANYIMAPGAGLPPTVADRKEPVHRIYFWRHAGNNTMIVNGTTHGRQQGSWNSNSYLWMNTTVNVGAEPKHLEDPIAPNFSFATQFLDDTINDDQQRRTLSTIRTSETTGYYFDMFRSKSLGENNFHDYIYHNLGDVTNIMAMDGTELAVSPTNRYQNDIGDIVQSPGWRYFENTNVTEPINTAVHVRFDLNETNTYMNMFAPSGVAREYTKAVGPPTREAKGSYINKKTQILAIRQQGEAWDKPYVHIFEPSKSTNTSVKSVQHIFNGDVIAGAKVVSEVNDTKITDYIFSSSTSSNIVYSDINFTGEFGIVRTELKDGKTDVSLYLGKGSSLKFLDETIIGDSEGKAYTEYTLDYEYFSEIAPNNFTIEAISETCTGKGNGKIVINALEKFNYEVSINGVDYNFTEETTIEDLNPGTYEFCISIKDSDFRQCYQVTIDEATSVSGKISTTKTGKVAIDIDKGVAPYKVIKNGVQVLETHEKHFIVDAEQGDEIEVKTGAECQGSMLSKINFLSEIKLYPNPTTNTFTILSDFADWQNLSIYNTLGVKVYSNTTGDKKLILNAKDHEMTAGMYFIVIQDEQGKQFSKKLILK